MKKNELIQEMEKYYGEDKNRIKHTRKVLNYAEEIMKKSYNLNFDRKIVIYTAILHDIGIPLSEEKYGSAAGKYQEIEGPPIARKIMKSCSIPPVEIEEVCEIIANHHSPGEIDSDNFKIFYDADWLVNFPAGYNIRENQDKIESIVDKLYYTEAAKKIAREEFILEE
ncbi:MAG: HD domain-containing protein [Halanaerobiales bacterium]